MLLPLLHPVAWDEADSASAEQAVRTVAALGSVPFVSVASTALDMAQDVSTSDLAALHRALRACPWLACDTDTAGWTLLHRIARFGKGNCAAKCVQLLLAAKSDEACKPTPAGVLPLHLALEHMGAASGGQESILALLNAHPAAALVPVRRGAAPLHSAAQGTGCTASNLNLILQLLQANPAAAKARAGASQMTVLHYAMQQLIGTSSPSSARSQQDAGDPGCAAVGKGAPDNNDKDRCWLPLHFAALYFPGNTAGERCLKALLEAYPEAGRECLSDPFVSPPLHLLIQNKAKPSPVMAHCLFSAYPAAIHTQGGLQMSVKQTLDSSTTLPQMTRVRLLALYKGETSRTEQSSFRSACVLHALT